jgi:serine/threonine protein kinase
MAADDNWHAARSDPQQRIGRFRVQRVLGRGAMARVLLALDERINRLVAIKVLEPHLASNPEIAHRFLNEAARPSSNMPVLVGDNYPTSSMYVVY